MMSHHFLSLGVPSIHPFAFFGILIALWSIAWKGWSLWIAAEKKDKVWFVVLLILNTAGILDILYIYFFSKKNFGKKKQEGHHEHTVA